MNVAAAITAGGAVDGQFAAVIGTRLKALARIRGVTLLERTVGALRDAGVERIAVVAPPEAQTACAALSVCVIPAAATGGQNQLLALRAWPAQARLLYVTCDMPYITADAVQAFLDRSDANELTMPLTQYGDFVRRFPGAPPFGITLAGERVVNGGMFCIPWRALHVVERLAIALFEARKNPLAIARLASVPFLLRYLLRRLSVTHAERYASRVLGVPARAVRGAPPELAYDVDTLAEYAYAATHP